MKKIVVIVLGIIFSLFVLESTIRIVNFIYQNNLNLKRKTISENSELRIYCYGDSFTRGMGAPEGFDFPAQLNFFLILNKFPKVKVVNRGVSGSNSAQILAKIKSDLKVNKPDCIVILGGGANLWNSWGYESGFNRWIRKIKIYGLIKHLIFCFQSKK